MIASPFHAERALQRCGAALIQLVGETSEEA